MEKRTTHRWGFLFLSFVLLIVAGSWKPTIYGNDEASIKRYLYQEQEWGDHVQLLAVRDHNQDRFAVFRLETKKPDERFIVRFRQNEDGNYEADRSLRQMYGPYPVQGVYSQALGRSTDSRKVSYAIWNEAEELAEVRFQPESGPEASVHLPLAPALTVCEFQSTGSWSTTYYDNRGNKL